MSYDHSNKPKDATHIVADLYGMNAAKRRANEACLYRKQEEGIWYAFHHDAWHEISAPEPQRYQMIPTQWTGEGLPPVGTICEHHRLGGVISDSASWSPVTIIAHVIGDPRISHVAVYMPCMGSVPCVGQGIAETFRPIRTPEQIAAEERTYGIAEMCKVFKCVRGSLGEEFAAELYDAGYRKQVTP